jgi:hypothetical protein
MEEEKKVYKERGYLEDQGVDWSLGSERRPRHRWEDGIRMDLTEIVLGMWIGFDRPRTGTGGGCCEVGDEPSVSCVTELVRTVTWSELTMHYPWSWYNLGIDQILWYIVMFSFWLKRFFSYSVWNNNVYYRCTRSSYWPLSYVKWIQSTQSNHIFLIPVLILSFRLVIHIHLHAPPISSSLIWPP